MIGLYQLLVFLAVLLCLLLLIFIAQQIKARGSIWLIALLLAAMVWLTGTALAGSPGPLTLRLFWYRLAQQGATWFPLLWLFFIMAKTGLDTRVYRRQMLALAGISLAFTLLIGTDSLHGLYWRVMPDLTTNSGFSAHRVLGPAGIANQVYSGILILFCLVLLGRSLFRLRGQNLGQAVILLLCSLLPWITHLLILITPPEASFSALLPYIFNLTALLLGFGLVRYRMFHLVPVADRSIVANFTDAVLILNLDNQIVHLNPAAEVIIKQPARKLTGQRIATALAGCPDLLALCSAGYTDSPQTLMIRSGEEIRYYEVAISPLRDRYDYPVGRIVTMRNITRRVNAEKASQRSQMLLKISEEKYRTLVENITEVFFTLNNEGQFTFVSSAIERLTGYTAENILGKYFKDLIYPEDLPAVEENLTLNLRGQLQDLEVRILDLQNRIRWVRIYGSRIYENGEPAGLQGFAADITERKQVEMALERRASQLTMLNLIGEQMASVIELKNLLALAPGLIQKYLGYYHIAIFTPDAASSRLIMQSVSGAFTERFPENYAINLSQGMVGWAASHKTTLLANDVRLEPRYVNHFPDKVFTRSELAVPICVGDELVGVLDAQSPLLNAFDDNDVRVMETIANQMAIAIENARLYDEVRRQLKELEAANASLREMDRIKSQFLANMSHELRTPLNSIIGFSEVLIDALAGPLLDEQKEYMQDILNSGRHLLALINDLLDFSKMDAGRMTLEPAAFAVPVLFEELLATLLPLTERKSQQVIFEPEGLLPPITADRLRLKQVFLNLLSNANKFSPEGSLITVRCCQSGEDRLLFSVINPGIGIHPAHHEWIFEEFRQVDGSMTREVPGTGLGLAISRRIVEMHGGRIWVESELGQGATFFVDLPVDCSCILA